MKIILYLLVIFSLPLTSCSESYNMEEEIIPVEKLMDNKYIDMVANNTYKHELSYKKLEFGNKDNIQFAYEDNIYDVKIDTYILMPDIDTTLTNKSKILVHIEGKTGEIKSYIYTPATFLIINSDSIQGRTWGTRGYWIKQ
ncbi:hypothetical protein IR083_09740 [Dysgonomonas sp. GY75]|uniref:hypothetical protein n=1 Tax=Dysgonomonas sp. GY75 TaxID=2780419 RepID=UPI001883F3E4|nr:hypothetical protein [Dysgonomonas sp. GY75]MBF0649101.1 hypothetical protein [Dysgonomonas sp. GY75]